MMHGVQWIKELMAMVERDKAENWVCVDFCV